MALKSREERLTTQVTFAAGLNLRDGGDELQPHEASAILNMQFSERGAAIARLGCTALSSVGSASHRVLSMHLFERGSNPPQMIINLSDGSLRYSTDLINWTNIATGLSTTAPFSYENFNGAVYMTNGVDDYRKWNGTTQTTFGAIPKGKYLRLWQDTMYMAGVSGELTKLYQSAPGDAESYPDFVQLAKDDGDEITGLTTDGLFLIAAKRHKVWVVYDASILANRLIDHEKGCESHFSMINHENNVYWLSRKGIVRWLAQSPGEIVSGRLDPLFAPGLINFDKLDMTYAYRLGHTVGWTIPGASAAAPNFQLEYYPNLPEKPMTLHRMPARAFATWRDGITETLVAGSNGANKVLQAFSGDQDDGAGFVSFIEKGWVDFDWPNHTKYLRRARILGRGSFSVHTKTDYDDAIKATKSIVLPSTVDLWDSSDVWDDTQQWGAGGATLKWADYHPDVYGRFFGFRFEGTITGNSFRKIDVAGQPTIQVVGQWGVHELILHAIQMGDRM